MTFEEFKKDCELPLCRKSCKHHSKCDQLEFVFASDHEHYDQLQKLYRKEKLEKLLDK